ncbi:MAG: hypothetical protein IPJ01_11790 [Micavibrio sp.]|nr:hypothetical protein [Micavibrio sp.]
MNTYNKHNKDLLYPDFISGVFNFSSEYKKKFGCNIVRKYIATQDYFVNMKKNETFVTWDYGLGRKIRINSEGSIAEK